MAFRRFGVIGAGAWGTALALVAARNGHDVVLWSRDAATAEAIARDRRNPRYLSDFALDRSIRATGDLGKAAAAEALLLAVPAQSTRAAAEALAPHVGAETPLVICAKGFERGSGALMSEVLAATLPGRPLAVLSGPTFAAEIARGLPAAVTLACRDGALGARLVRALGSASFRPYGSRDVIGAQVGGAVKNVLAIGCGIAEGHGLGDNARAALITRGLAEVGRLSAALGAKPETLMGLSGLGDLVLTCASEQSRNYRLGLALGRGEGLRAALDHARGVVEGVATAASVAALAARLGVEMPICAAVDAVLHRNADLDASITALLARPFKAESLA